MSLYINKNNNYFNNYFYRFYFVFVTEKAAIQITSGTFSWEKEDQPTLKKCGYFIFGFVTISAKIVYCKKK